MPPVHSKIFFLIITTLPKNQTKCIEIFFTFLCHFIYLQLNKTIINPLVHFLLSSCLKLCPVALMKCRDKKEMQKNRLSFTSTLPSIPTESAFRTSHGLFVFNLKLFHLCEETNTEETVLKW